MKGWIFLAILLTVLFGIACLAVAAQVIPLWPVIVTGILALLLWVGIIAVLKSIKH